MCIGQGLTTGIGAHEGGACSQWGYGKLEYGGRSVLMLGPGPKEHGPCLQEAHSPSPLYPFISSTVGVRQGHFPPWSFIPCAYAVWVTHHLPEEPQERTGPKSFSIQGSTTQKAAQTEYSGERKRLLPAGAAQRSPFAGLTKSFTQFPVFLARDRDSRLSSGLGNRGCQVRPAFWKSRPEGIVKGPIWGAQEPTPTPEGRPFVEEVGLRPLVRCKGFWRCFYIVSPHMGAVSC